jgi:hypothetical protein
MPMNGKDTITNKKNRQLMAVFLCSLLKNHIPKTSEQTSAGNSKPT